jgi:hypothetical protein
VSAALDGWNDWERHSEPFLITLNFELGTLNCRLPLTRKALNGAKRLNSLNVLNRFQQTEITNFPRGLK